MVKFFKKLIIVPRYGAAALVEAYQVLLSPDHSWLRIRYPYGYCRHYPTCSEYSRQSFLKYGVFKGFTLAVKRVLRCHPWAEPGIDPVP